MDDCKVEILLFALVIDVCNDDTLEFVVDNPDSTTPIRVAIVVAKPASLFRAFDSSEILFNKSGA
jgi:hypothetical protein